jgi:hypothetical protein
MTGILNPPKSLFGKLRAGSFSKGEIQNNFL